MTASIKQRRQRSLTILRRYAVHLGIPRRRRRYEGEPLWNGRTLMWVESDDDEAHEIAHWLLASPERRQYVNYGWWDDYQWSGPDSEFYPGDRDEEWWLANYNFSPDGYTNHDEEVQACMLQFSMLVRTGSPDVKSLYDSYSFYRPNRDHITGVTEFELDPDVRTARRAVQSHVADFSRWLANQP